MAVAADRPIAHLMFSPVLFSPVSIAQPATGTPWVKISIADTGNGIPEAIRQRVFDPFFTTKSIGKGAGIGLSISYQTVTDRHQGTLDGCSQEGQGTELTIQIPVRQ
jgi:signal transduction histidine kinase